MARISLDEVRAVIDLGCGPGNSTPVLGERWPRAKVTGLDNSAAMLERARQDFPQYEWAAGGGADYDVGFSNAALQWLADHQFVYPRLLKRVRTGGALAIEVPTNMDAPVHQIMRDLASSPAWRDYFAPEGVANGTSMERLSITTCFRGARPGSSYGRRIYSRDA